MLSGCAIVIETCFFQSWPLEHVKGWIAVIDAAKVSASVGSMLAISGKGWRRLVFLAIGVIELWIIWPLGTVG